MQNSVIMPTFAASDSLDWKSSHHWLASRQAEPNMVCKFLRSCQKIPMSMAYSCRNIEDPTHVCMTKPFRIRVSTDITHLQLDFVGRLMRSRACVPFMNASLHHPEHLSSQCGVKKYLVRFSCSAEWKTAGQTWHCSHMKRLLISFLMT